MLSELYWYVRVVEAGGFSAAAERTGVAKSSLSRRIMQLEKRLDVQLLNRSTRRFAMTAIGEQIYRNALDMLTSAETAEIRAREANDVPSGLIRLAAPAILSSWVLKALERFQRRYPKVQFAFMPRDTVVSLTELRLDLALTLDSVPLDSGDIVVRPLATLDNLIVGSPALLQRLARPASIAEVGDSDLLALSGPQELQPWRLQDHPRTVQTPALKTDSLAALKDAAEAGLGLACLPLLACHRELEAGDLCRACKEDEPSASALYVMTPSYRGTPQAVRSLIDHLRNEVADRPGKGMHPAIP